MLFKTISEGKNMLYFCEANHEILGNNDNEKISSISYSLLKYVMLLEYGKIIPENYELKKNYYGKPYFDNIKIFFNISHSNECIVCGVSNYELGVDIQKAELFFNEKLYTKVCSVNEIVKIKKSKEAADLFLRYWVLKESYIKCIGKSILNRNLYIDFSNCESSYFELDSKKYSCFDYKNYKIAVCSEGEYYDKFISINLSDFWQVYK